MDNKRITLSEAVKFHGHLGPYLVLGILAGELGLRRLKCKKYFGIDVLVWGAKEKPKSCFIDGLQLSTDGKGNIKKLNGPRIKVELRRCDDKRRIAFVLKDGIIRKIGQLKSHKDSELLANKLYKTVNYKLFNLKLETRT